MYWKTKLKVTGVTEADDLLIGAEEIQIETETLTEIEKEQAETIEMETESVAQVIGEIELVEETEKEMTGTVIDTVTEMVIDAGTETVIEKETEMTEIGPIGEAGELVEEMTGIEKRRENMIEEKTTEMRDAMTESPKEKERPRHLEYKWTPMKSLPLL